jgi:pilus assembly protein Flp/PilA
VNFSESSEERGPRWVEDAEQRTRDTKSMDQITPGLLHKTSEAVKRLGSDRDGVASFEYVVVAACIIAGVSLEFGTGGPLQTALTGAISAISSALIVP